MDVAESAKKPFLNGYYQAGEGRPRLPRLYVTILSGAFADNMLAEGMRAGCSFKVCRGTTVKFNGKLPHISLSYQLSLLQTNF